MPVDRPWFPHHIGKAMHHNIWTGIATENAPALRARTHVHRIRFKLLLEPHTVAPHTVNTSDKVEKCVTCQSWVARRGGGGRQVLARKRSQSCT